jgi:hypothetical protein
MHTAACLAGALLLAFPRMLPADPLAWLNAARAAAGAPAVGVDGLLSDTAARWAGMLAEAGVLGHRGADGTNVLDRYRALGGTEAHVGEILGAGPSLEAVEEGWLASASHRKLALEASWTHAGWGSARAGAAEVWVVVFCEKRALGLTIVQEPDRLLIEGAFGSAAVRPVFFAGLRQVQPSLWEPSTMRFRFEVPGQGVEGYFRLGYEPEGSGFVLTNAFTLPPGTGFPAGPARSSAPGPSP